MRKKVIGIGLGFILIPLFLDLALVVGLVLFGLSGASLTAKAVALPIVGVFGGGLCIFFTILTFITGLILVIVGAFIPEKEAS